LHNDKEHDNEQWVGLFFVGGPYELIQQI